MSNNINTASIDKCSLQGRDGIIMRQHSVLHWQMLKNYHKSQNMLKSSAVSKHIFKYKQFPMRKNKF